MANETVSHSFPVFISSTQSLDFGAMTAGTAQLTTPAVVGARIGDAVLVTRAVDDAVITAELTLYGWVETDDLVTVQVTSNDATATDNLAAASVNILVFK